MSRQAVIDTIIKLKKERDAVILAHSYQVKEVQEVADFVGDSLELSREVTKVECSTIVFCGVHFMAESAKLLNPQKKVLLPVMEAGCPMADMVTPEALKRAREKYPDAAVVCYINSSAAVKAESDICCTSSNAVKVVLSMPNKRILFVPDKNLASYVAGHVPGKEIIPWEGFCATHSAVTERDVEEARIAHPGAEVAVHPECSPAVARMADYVGSTSGIIERVSKSSCGAFIIGTEAGLLYRLQKDNPRKRFYLLSKGLICPDMKKTRLEDVLQALEKGKYLIEVEDEVRRRAVLSLERMLSVV
ncbi:MAG: Quinolinate synthetase [Firmicutes bacterium]|nr:Quinolinate synthetase [Bacillota bacterium]MDI6704898.1 quinolinate synthase NadA [Bacillota bacterium]